MAQNLVYGTATVYGSLGSVLITGYAATSGNSVNSIDGGNEAEIEYHKDALGAEIGMGVKNRKQTVNVDMFPTGSTIANAAGGLRLPPIPSLVTLAGFASSHFNGTWAYLGNGSISQNESACKLTLPLTQWSGSVSTTAMVTACTE